jgi:hypothetical protein
MISTIRKTISVKTCLIASAAFLALIIAFFILLIIIFNIPDSIYGNISWQLNNGNGVTLPGVRVKVISGISIIKTGNSDGIGNYVIKGIKPGQYEISAYTEDNYSGVRMCWKKWITVLPFQNVQLDFNIQNAMTPSEIDYEVQNYGISFCFP